MMAEELNDHVLPPGLSFDWQAEAACARHPELTTDDFFLESRFQKNSPEYRAAKARAKAVCDACPVKQACRDFAERTHQPEGIWGGETANERRARRYPRRRINGRLTYVKGGDDGA